MLRGIVDSYLTLFTEISIEENKCLGEKCPRGFCTEVCPVAGQRENCLVCGACTVSCPTQALTLRKWNFHSWAVELLRHKAPASCFYAGLEGDMKGEANFFPCKYSLPPIPLLALLLARKEIRIYLGECEKCKITCNHPKKPEGWHWFLATLDHLGLRDRIIRVKLDKGGQGGISRRELFGKWKELRKGVVSSAGPGPGDIWWQIIDLALTGEQRAKLSKLEIKGPVCAQGCNLCKHCAKVCPRGALRAAEASEGRELVWQPRLCFSCGWCAQSCPQGVLAFAGIPAEVYLRGEEVRMAKKAGVTCRQCGIFFEAGQVCPNCAKGEHLLESFAL